MRPYIIIEKPVGITPLQAIETHLISNPAEAQLPHTYAGRLDPMASGKLLVLIGDECKKRTRYDGLDKEYEFELLLNVATDTGDVLGIPQPFVHAEKPGEEKITEVLKSLRGKHTLPYPAFSSKTVQGIPLFEYALKGTLDAIERPVKKIRIYKMEYLGGRIIEREELIEKILAKISLLSVPVQSTRIGSDFRKKEIDACWKKFHTADKLVILKFKATVSAGTYIRTLAPLIAERLGTIGLAYSIHRSRIGRYQPLFIISGFWSKIF